MSKNKVEENDEYAAVDDALCACLSNFYGAALNIISDVARHRGDDEREERKEKDSESKKEKFFR